MRATYHHPHYAERKCEAPSSRDFPGLRLYQWVRQHSDPEATIARLKHEKQVCQLFKRPTGKKQKNISWQAALPWQRRRKHFSSDGRTGLQSLPAHTGSQASLLLPGAPAPPGTDTQLSSCSPSARAPYKTQDTSALPTSRCLSVCRSHLNKAVKIK